MRYRLHDAKGRRVFLDSRMYRAKPLPQPLPNPPRGGWKQRELLRAQDRERRHLSPPINWDAVYARMPRVPLIHPVVMSQHEFRALFKRVTSGGVDIPRSHRVHCEELGKNDRPVYYFDQPDPGSVFAPQSRLCYADVKTRQHNRAIDGVQINVRGVRVYPFNFPCPLFDVAERMQRPAARR